MRDMSWKVRVSAVVMAVALMVATLFSAPPRTEAQGCERVDCNFVLEVCNERGCYWITQCSSGFFIEANCSPIRNGCQFSWCGRHPIWADNPATEPLTLAVLKNSAMTTAQDDPFVALGLMVYGELNFLDEGIILYSVPKYIFPSSQDAVDYVASWADNNDPSTRLDYEKLSGDNPAKELVTVSLKIYSESHKELTVQHDSKSATIDATLNNGVWTATVQ